MVHHWSQRPRQSPPPFFEESRARMASHPLLQRFSPSQPPGLNAGAGCFTSPGLIDAFDCIHIRGFTRWHKKNDTNMFNLFWKQLDYWDDFKQKGPFLPNHHEEGVGSEDKMLETASFIQKI